MSRYPLTKAAVVELLPIELSTIDQILSKVHDLGAVSEGLLNVSILNWSKALKRKSSCVLKIAGNNSKSNTVFFNNKGLVNEFASLKSHSDIEIFAKKYGLLGIEYPSTEQVNSPHTLIKATLIPSMLFFNYGYSVLEPIELWEWHIKEVGRILKLYRAIRLNKSEEYLNKLIKIELHTGQFGDSIDDRQIYERYFVHWADGDVIQMLPPLYEEESLSKIAQFALADIIESHIRGGINLGIGDYIFDPARFKIIEERYTNSLAAAIYYELWGAITGSKNVYLCENENCRLPFVKSGRKKYCNEACKQEAYRIRLAEKERK